MPVTYAASLESGEHAIGRRAGAKSDASSPVSRWYARSCRPAAVIAAALLAAVVPAAESPVVVGVATFPPHVMESDGNFAGFDIDVWNEVSNAIGLDSTFRLMQFSDLIEALKDGEVDAGMAGISITHEREIHMDFSHPYMNSGLRILTTVDQDPALLRVLRALATEAELGALGYLAAFVLLCSHILYFAEHGSSGINDRYFPGIFEAAWCILATITTVGYGDVTPAKWLGRLVSLVVMVIGIALFGVAIGKLSAGLMMEELKSDISGPQDLSGRRVATVAGTTSTDVAIRYGATLREVEQIEAGYRLLESGEVDAIPFDAAPLMQYAVADGNTTVTVVGPLIERQVYGIAFPAGTNLRESVNRALLELEESGDYGRIYNRWFGPSHQR